MWAENESFPVLENEVRIGRYPTAPQLKKLAVAMFRGEHLTPLIAMQRYGCCRLSERCRELQALGWGIQKKWVTTESGARVMSYFL